MKRLLRPLGLQDALVVIGYISLVLVQLDNFALDPGVGWHLETGQYVLSQGIPYTDPFLAFDGVRSWIADQWFGATILAALYQWGSWPLIYGVLTAIYLVTYYFVLYFSVSKVTQNFLLSAIATLIAFKLGQIHFILRPVLFSFLFFSIVYGAVRSLLASLENDRLAEAKRKLARCYLYLPPLFLIWANIHPAFVLSFLLMGCVVIALPLDQIVLGKDRDAKFQLGFIGLCVLCFLATLLNPYGIALHQSVLTLGTSSFAMNFHMEWLPPNFKEMEGQVLEFVIALTLLSLFLGGSRKLKWSFFDLISLGVFTHMSMQFMRILPFFGIVATVPFVRIVENFANARLFESSKLFGGLLRRFKKLSERERKSYHGYPFLAISLLLVVLWPICYQSIPLFQGSFGPSDQEYPYKALEVIEQASAGEESVAVVCDPNWAGFVTFYSDKRLKPIIDDRNTLIGEEFYKDFFENLKAGADWRSYIARFDARYLLLKRSSSFMEYLRATSGMKILYQDEIAVVFDAGK